MNPFRVENDTLTWSKAGELVWVQAWGEHSVEK